MSRNVTVSHEEMLEQMTRENVFIRAHAASSLWVERPGKTLATLH